jgi:hypothetical protein
MKSSPVSISDILSARERIVGRVLRTPLVVLLSGGNIDMALHRRIVCGQYANVEAAR